MLNVLSFVYPNSSRKFALHIYTVMGIRNTINKPGYHFNKLHNKYCIIIEYILPTHSLYLYTCIE